MDLNQVEILCHLAGKDNLSQHHVWILVSFLYSLHAKAQTICEKQVINLQKQTQGFAIAPKKQKKSHSPSRADDRKRL